MVGVLSRNNRPKNESIRPIRPSGLRTLAPRFALPQAPRHAVHDFLLAPLRPLSGETLRRKSSIVANERVEFASFLDRISMLRIENNLAKNL